MNPDDIQRFCENARRAAAWDIDLNSSDAKAVSNALAELLPHCTAEIGVKDDTKYTRTLIEMWVCYADGIPGGSATDYCASAALNSIEPTFGSLKLRADKETCDKLVERIKAKQFNVDRMIEFLEEAGIV